MLNAELLPLQNDRALLRPMADRDAASYALGTSDAAVRRFAHLPESEYTASSVSKLIRGPLAHGLEAGDLAVLTIADAATDDFAGSLVIFDVDDAAAEVGFWVHPDHRGKCIATNGLALAIELARRSELRTLTARTVPANTASHSTLKRAGFVETGTAPGTAPSGKTVTLRQYRRELQPRSNLPLTAGELTLRLHTHRDTEALLAIYRKPEVSRFLLDDPWSARDAKRHVAQRMAKTGLDDGATALALVVELEGQVIGDVQLWLTDVEHRVAEIGWVFDPEFGGRGLATQAAGAVLDYAFGPGQVHRVAAQMDARNTASARLAERLGLRREAHLRQDWWSKGEWTDTLINAALASDRATPGDLQPVH